MPVEDLNSKNKDTNNAPMNFLVTLMLRELHQ